MQNTLLWKCNLQETEKFLEVTVLAHAVHTYVTVKCQAAIVESRRKGPTMWAQIGPIPEHSLPLQKRPACSLGHLEA